MSQPSAYPPAASFRPASGWQFEGAAPQPASRETLRGISPLVAAIVSVGLVLYGVQGIVTVAPVVDVDAFVALRILAIWAPTVVLISLGIAVASRSIAIIGTLSALLLLVAIAVGVFGVLGVIAWWETMAIVPMLAALAGAALAWAGIATDRASLSSVGEIVVVSGVVLHALLVIAGPIATGQIADVGAFLLNAAPPQALGIVAIVASVAARTSRAGLVAAGIAIVLLAFGILVGPLAAAVRTVDPNVGAVAVVVVRSVLVAAAGLLVLLAARR